MVQSWRPVIYEDLDQTLDQCLVESLCVQILMMMKSCNRSLLDLVQVLLRRSCGDHCAVFSERSLHEELTDAIYQKCLFAGGSWKVPADLARSSPAAAGPSMTILWDSLKDLAQALVRRSGGNPSTMQSEPLAS